MNEKIDRLELVLKELISIVKEQDIKIQELEKNQKQNYFDEIDTHKIGLENEQFQSELQQKIESEAEKEKKSSIFSFFKKKKFS